MSDDIELRVPFRIRDGHRADFEKLTEQMLAVFSEKDPATRSYSVYVDPESNAGTFLEHYGSNEAVLTHFANGQELFPHLFEHLEISEIHVHGEPSAEVKAFFGNFPMKAYYYSRLAGLSN